ncbi:MAG: efflux RND transporter periplasmic adaptor subunit [Gammaproteobacteria bacterium]|nr:efflux RND transporter periplasmic adaptor subunit [Gammaproteobacteria bacterium]
MTNKKQVIAPFIILFLGIGAYVLFSSMKRPPEEKEEFDKTPIVAVETIRIAPMTLQVNSYGVVKPKYETELVAQVSGQIVELSDAFVRGGLVKKGELLARIDPNDYSAALISAQATMASAQASLETEQAHSKVAEREWSRISSRAPSELSLRKPQLAQELARVKAAQAAVLIAERNIERTEIRAPYDAMIEKRNIGLGSFVGVGSQVGKLLGTNIAEVRLPVADNQLKYLRNLGKDATVLLSGSFAGQELEWHATIIRDEGVVDTNSRMSYLVAQITDPYKLEPNKNTEISPLRFGSYVTASILGIELANATTVPRHLIVKNRIAILDSDSKLHYADINIIRQEGADVIINEGFKEGDRLITSALDYPVEGMKLALPDSDSHAEPEEIVEDPQIIASSEN